MAQEQIPDTGTTALLSEFNTKLRDIEERQRLIKDRVLLIGENLVEGKEESTQEIAELKVKTKGIEQEIQRLKARIIHGKEKYCFLFMQVICTF